MSVSALALGLGLVCGQGCAQKPELVAPQAVVSPYDSTSGDVLWAVAPIRNESGASFADTEAVADSLTARVDEVEGIACVPFSRVLQGMRAAGLSEIATPGDARRLAGVLGVDAVIVGTLTAYDPYNPPTLGIAVALFAREGRMGSPADELDPVRLQRAYTDQDLRLRNSYAEFPLASVSETFDGKNHGVLMELRNYADGRQSNLSALGWRGYLASMELYTQFASHAVVRRLLDQERLRLARGVVPNSSTTDADSSRSTVSGAPGAIRPVGAVGNARGDRPGRDD